MELDLKLNNINAAIVAVSGGPDSMALLNLLEKTKIFLVVVCINYQTRGEDSNRDWQLVNDYCQKRKIKFASLMAPAHKSGNAQNYYRQIRLNFIEQIANKYHIKDVFFGHTLDDHIETYLMQLKRKVKAFYFGLEEKRQYKDLIFHRPLLNFYKKQLLDYLNQNSVPYRIDQSNLAPVYTRNKIRLELSDADKEKYLAQLKQLNDRQTAILNQTTLPLELNINITIPELIKIIHQVSGFYISEKFAAELIKITKSKKTYISVLLNCNYYLIKSYQHLFIIEKTSECFPVISVKSLKNDFLPPYFSFDKKTPSYATFDNKDLPLTIRSATENDTLNINGKHKRVFKFYSDKKIFHHLRKAIPLVITKSGYIIMIAGYFYHKDEKNNRIYFQK